MPNAQFPNIQRPFVNLRGAMPRTGEYPDRAAMKGTRLDPCFSMGSDDWSIGHKPCS